MAFLTLHPEIIPHLIRNGKTKFLVLASRNESFDNLSNSGMKNPECFFKVFPHRRAISPYENAYLFLVTDVLFAVRSSEEVDDLVSFSVMNT